MPRNGDGSGDSGPHDGHEILHGTTGDKTLQHTKHVAPMPKPEEGEALPGMNASGGVAAPLNDASEEYGATAPRKERLEDDEDETSTSKSGASGAGNHRSGASTSSGNKKSAADSQQSGAKASSGGSSGHDNHGSHEEHGKHDLEDISREKAKRYVNLDEEDVQHAAAGNKSNDSAERSSQRAPRDVGTKGDTEQTHGKASSGKGNNEDEKQEGKKSGRQGSSGNEQQGSEKKQKLDNEAEADDDAHETDPMRHNAAKFVNIEE